MKVINLFSGAGAGKSTLAAYVFSILKRKHIKTELVGEVAKELIYLGNEVQLMNQVYILGCQYRKLKDLERSGIDVAVSDSPLMLQMAYCRDKPYFNELIALVNKLNEEFENIDIYVKRVKPYQTYGRVGTEADAKILDEVIWNSMPEFDYIVDGDDDGAEFVAEELITLLNS